MKNETDKPTPKGFFNTERIMFYLHASYLGTLRSGLSLLLEHPLDSIKTQWQDKLAHKNEKEIFNHIYNNKGISGFYRGFFPNFLRIISQQIYRWPLMIFFPKFFEKKFGKSFGLHKVFAGLAIANIELFINTPLERMKIYLMTSDIGNDKRILGQFFIQNKSSIWRELYRGWEPTFWRGNVSWVSLLYCDYYFKRFFRRLRGRDALGKMDLIVISMLVCVGNVLAVMPFDFAKTQMQKDEHIFKTTLPLLVKYYHKYGLKVIYTGWRFKVLQYAINSLLTVMTLENLEVAARKLTQKF